MSKLDLSKIKSVHLNKGQFVEEVTSKRQIYLHHTAGSASATNVVNGWNKDNLGRVGTCVVIAGKGANNDKDGEIIQCFSSKYWASHLGLASKHFPNGIPYQNLDKNSIGIEVCNWGQLTLKGGKYFNYLNKEVPADQVTKLDGPYKGFIYFHKYTDAQIESVRQLLIYWKEQYNISLKYDYKQMFELSDNAFKGMNGLYTHNSVRKDKWDVYPCPRMIAMIKSLQE